MSLGRKSAPAFTLMECLFATAILSVAVLAICYSVTAGQKQTYSALYNGRAEALAEALMEEVVAHPYVAIGGANAMGPDGGETRAQFVSADDYDKFAEAAGTLKDRSLTLYPAVYQVFSRRVDIVVSTCSVPGTANPVTGLTVTVTVSDATGVKCQLQRFVR